MTREEQINAHCTYARFDYNEIFKRGAKWSDSNKHFTHEEAVKFVNLSIAWSNSDDTCEIEEYINKHWNDEQGKTNNQ